MKRNGLVALLAGATLSVGGCIVPYYADQSGGSDPN